MTFEERFSELKKIISKKRPKLGPVFAIQVNMTDSDCHGTFYIAYTDGTLRVEPYDYYDHTAMITADSKVLGELLEGTLTPGKAYEEGKIIIDGSLESAKELTKLCKKPVVKKAAPKKAEKKPEVKPEVKAEVKAEVKPEVKPAVKAEVKPEVKTEKPKKECKKKNK